MTLEPAAAGYLLASEPGQRLYRAFLAGRSPDTLRAYTQDVAAFAVFLGALSPSEAMTHLIEGSAGNGNALLLEYRARMIEDGLAPATINRRLAAIRSAVKLARTLGMTTWSPDISGLRVDAYRDTAGPGLSGTRAMLAAAHAQRDRAKAARDVALIRLMFDLGLRRGEVAGLDVDDVDRAGRRILVMGKGRRQKTPRTLPAATLGALEAWLEVRERFAEPDQAALFVNLAHHSAGQRITGRGLHHLIAQIGASVGLKTRPHGLRHASITAALDANNGDVRAVQQHARHTNPQTTMRYDDNRRDLAGQVASGLAGLLGETAGESG
jgi:integrase/recombinase XerC